MPRNRYYSGPPSDHYDGERFFTPGGPPDKTLGELARMLWNARSARAPWPLAGPTVAAVAPPARVEGRAIRLTFIGHSSFLLQTGGVNLLIDPVWSDRAGPFNWLGPRRVTPPGLGIEALPTLDAILLSHNHYDHMDIETLSRLARLRPCPVLTPLGNDSILTRADRRIDARAHDWGEHAAVGSARVCFAPARHWSARGRGDRRMALWASFVIETPGGKLYYAGDTGFGDGSLFDRIAREHGPFRLALIPIGAYSPRWFMGDQHCDPDEAVEIFRRLGAEQAFACHWGTFRLTDEPYDEPVQRLGEALAKAGIDPARFIARPPGSVVEIA